MKKLQHIFSILFLFLFCAPTLYAQDTIKISSQDLPYSIPVAVKPSEDSRMIYRWLENGHIVNNSNSITGYIVPSGKAAGIYTYIYQVKCEGCTDWLSSNPFTVEIEGNSQRRNASINPLSISVTFSPQSDLQGYASELIEMIENATEHIDISLYDFNNDAIFRALKKAKDKGIAIRMLYDGALEDRKQTGGSFSHRLESTGIDVRYVNKINHHKFAITDNSFLVTSSGNWTGNANWINDENTLWVNDAELVLRYRAEFEHLWNNSREFGQSYTWDTVSSDSLLNLIVDNPDVDMVFTSANYRTYISAANGPTFAKEGDRQKAADKIVELIGQAQSSIKIAANHLRSRPISEALLAKKEQNPAIDIKVYLDEQEHITASYNETQKENRENCLSGANTPAQIRDCLEKNFYYSYELIEAGIDVRFKTYAYKWDASTAMLMHNKYAVFDNETVATGSYNYSYNAETNSMENVLVFNSNAAAGTVEEFVNDFDRLWNTGRIEGYYDDILAYLDSGYRYVPVLFEPLSLTYEELGTLKAAIETACPAVKSNYFRNNGHLYSSYLRGVNFTYASNGKISNITNSQTPQFSIDYTYDSNTPDKFAGITFDGNGDVDYFENYLYNSTGKLTGFSSSLFDIDFSYTNDTLTGLNFGQGDYTWAETKTPEGSKIIYSTPYHSGFMQSEWNRDNLPVYLSDADDRNINWWYDSEGYVDSIASPDKNISFTNESNSSLVETSDGESLSAVQADENNLTVTSAGTVNAAIVYSLQELPDKKQTLNIALTSNNVASGTGRTANINYLYDVYGRVIGAGNLEIERIPYSGEIVSIRNANMQENRSYNDWGLLTQQTVMRDSVEYYRAAYEYDALQRITRVSESVQGTTALYDYHYNTAGQLASVYKDSVLTESYLYDSYGNRTNASTDFDYTYQHNTANRLHSFSWQQSGNTRAKEFSYNNSGQLTATANKTYRGSSATTTSSRSFDYDVFGNLNAVSWASQNLEYKYDAFDRQIATILNGSVKRKLIYGLNDQPIAELNENDRIINTYIYADGYTPVLMRKGNTDYYMISDIRGSVRMVVKVSDGNVLQQMDYDAFGNVSDDSNPGYTPFGYAGGLYEHRTGLVRFGARDYSAETGTWTAEDPIGFYSRDINFYAYVANDPINHIDPSGLSKGGNEEIYIKGVGKINRNLFHKTIKPNILKAVGKLKNFIKSVGKNPDIIVEKGKIILQGAKNSPFSKNTFPTGLKATDFFD
ncbi:MAG: phospholipase D-like domain-containing protein [Prevotellaceae bacterium]|jgi:RHS repeat-associated protein|nr:phospholipase D-like domain-containing protein [Prevotellaceae bacterium]